MPIPDWCFDAWPEAGVPVGGFDAACAELAAAGAAAPSEGGLGWRGTAHHHPSRMHLLELARQHPSELRGVVDVVDRQKAEPPPPASTATAAGEEKPLDGAAYLQRHGVEGAIAWLTDHLDDADIDAPLEGEVQTKTQEELGAEMAASLAGGSQLTAEEKKEKLDEALAKARAKKLGTTPEEVNDQIASAMLSLPT